MKDYKMTNVTEDVAFAISCCQDYRDTIDSYENPEHYDEVSSRITRLFDLYNALTGYTSFERTLQNETNNKTN